MPRQSKQGKIARRKQKALLSFAGIYRNLAEARENEIQG
jgi:hypothetical protein